MSKKKGFDNELVAPIMILVLGLFAMIFSISLFLNTAVGGFSVLGTTNNAGLESTLFDDDNSDFFDDRQINSESNGDSGDIYNPLNDGCLATGYSSISDLSSSVSSDEFFDLTQRGRLVVFDGEVYSCQ